MHVTNITQMFFWYIQLYAQFTDKHSIILIGNLSINFQTFALRQFKDSWSIKPKPCFLAFLISFVNNFWLNIGCK